MTDNKFIQKKIVFASGSLTMNNRVKKTRDAKIAAESSMSNSTNSICQDEECIGMVTTTEGEHVLRSGKDIEENRKSKTRSSMKFGNRGACRDEACIGKI
jgi:hypothetical protein